MTKTIALPLLLLLLTLLLLHVLAWGGDSECSASEDDRDKAAARPLKIGAIFAILVSSTAQVLIPILGKWVPSLSPEKDAFFVIKAFAAGVILATAFIHIHPESFERLTSRCLNKHPWQEFPFAGFIEMVSAIGTLMVDTVATGYFSRSSIRKLESGVSDGGMGDAEQGAAHVHVHVHVHAMHGYGHGLVALAMDDSPEKVLRHRIISQVLELGIAVHSVIIGITLGTSESPSSTRLLMAALCFHQFFEGIGLGGCIVQVMATNTLSLRSLLDNDKLLGPNFDNWYRKLKIVLEHERILYVIMDLAPAELAPNARSVVKDTYMKWLSDRITVRCIMRVAMFDELSRKFEEA